MEFEEFYTTWYSRVVCFAREYVISDVDAENIVQDVFLDLYERYYVLDQHIVPISYLFTCVKNRCIDHLRRQMLEREATKKIQGEFEFTLRMKLDSLEDFNTAILAENSIEDLLNKALQALPEKCRQIFVMSKLDGKKQKQIAEELHISINTVEAQMSVAYKKLRDELKSYSLFLFFII